MDGSVIHLTIGKANPNRANGINVIVHGLAEAYQKLGIRSEVWGITPSPEEPTFERSYPLRLFRFKSNRLGLDPQLRSALEALPRNTLVHFHGGLLPEFYFVARILRKCGIDWVLMPHGCYSKAALGLQTWKKRLYITLFDRFVIRGAKRIQLGAVDSANGLSEMIQAPQALSLPNGFGDPQGPFASLDQDTFTFSFCGRFATYHKGLDLLAEGFGLALKDGDVPMQLELIGKGPDQAEIEAALTRSGAAPFTQLPGPLFGEEKQQALANTSCFVLTSRHEGFPMALLEAASLGLPLVVTEETNFADYVRRWDCGLVVPELTPESIAATLRAMAAMPRTRLQEMGRHSVQLIREELLWDRIAERIQDEIYRPIWAAA